MQITRKIATGAAAAALSLASVAGIGLATTSHAGATPARHHNVHCRLKHGHNYPGGKCFISFSRSKYHRGDTVKLHAETFPAHHKVKVHLSCRKGFSKHVDTTHAGRHGGVNDKFTLPNKTPKGHCTVRVRGGGSSVEGSFKARH